MASRALVQLEPETMRLYAFTIEATTNELEKALAEGVVPTISGRPVGDIIRDLAANMRQGADKAEGEFKSKLGTRDERRQRREERKKTRGTGRDFGGEDFPGAEAFGLGASNVGAGGGQQAPGVPPLSTAEVVSGAPGVIPPPLATGNVAEKAFDDDSL